MLSFEQDWAQPFGRPQLLKVDPTGWQRAHAFRDWCRDRGMVLRMAPGEARNRQARVERTIGLLKDTVRRLAHEGPTVGHAEISYLACAARQ